MTSRDEIRRRSAGAATPPSDSGARSIRGSDSTLQRVARLVHKWAGLAAAAWLFVLGATGFFLNNADWRWLQQTVAPSWLTTLRLAQTAVVNVARLWQIDPDHSAIRVAAGPRGMWRTMDGGAHWEPTLFDEGASPQILAVEPDPSLGWGRLWIGADEGLYASTDRGATAQLVALPGARISALAAGAARDELLGVIDKSSLVRFSTNDPRAVQPIDIAPLEEAARPTEIRLLKYIQSIHRGRGLFDAATSHLVNEAGGLAFAFLALTGLAYWALPKSWNARAKAGGRSLSAEAKRETLLWLYRSHSAIIGLVASPALLYLAVTGIFVGHDRELGDWLRSIRVPSEYFTPAFALASWNGRIDALVGYPGVPHSFSIGNHLGMFTTIDDGRSWAREESVDGRPVAAASRMRRLGDRVIVMTGMSGSALIRSDDGRSVEADIAGRAPRPSGPARATQAALQDVAYVDGELYWKTGGRFVVTNMAGKPLETLDAEPPHANGAPLVMWLRQLHTGVLIWSEWRWVNDVFAGCAIILIVSGLIRWQRRKWA